MSSIGLKRDCSLFWGSLYLAGSYHPNSLAILAITISLLIVTASLSSSSQVSSQEVSLGKKLPSTSSMSPEPQNDFIFATIGEELGWIGQHFVLCSSS